MCIDPISLALMAGSAALSAGGAYVSNQSQQRAAAEAQLHAQRDATAQAKARNDELRAYQARMAALRDQNSAAVARTVQEYSPEDVQARQDGNNARREQAINEAITPAQGVDDIPLGGNAPQIVKDSIAKRLRDVFAEATDRAKKDAKVASYGDGMTDGGLLIGDAGRAIDVTNSFARQETAMLPAQQDFAAYAASLPGLPPRSPSVIGPLMQALGSIGGSVAGSGYLRPAAAVPKPTTLTLMPTSL